MFAVDSLDPLTKRHLDSGSMDQKAPSLPHLLAPHPILSTQSPRHFLAPQSVYTVSVLSILGFCILSQKHSDPILPQW